MSHLTRCGAFRACFVTLLPLLAACGSNGGSASHDDGGADGGSGKDAASHDGGAKRDASDAGKTDAKPTCPAPGDGGIEASSDPSTFVVPPTSCAYTCPISPDCAETKTPYQCPNLGAWSCVPHAATCGDWDGGYPAVVPGKCTATAPTGAALSYAGVDGGIGTLADGRHMQPAGQFWIFDEAGLQGGLTTGMVGVPGTNYVVTVDDGVAQHVVRLIDTSKIGTGSTPVVSFIQFDNPSTLNSGIAFRAPDLVLVATDNPGPQGADAGAGTGTVQALTFNSAAGTIALDTTRSLHLPAPTDGSSNWYVSGVAVSPDGTRAVVTGVTETHLLVFDVGAGSATYGSMLGEIDLGQAETFQVAFDPLDSATAYVSLWSGASVMAIDISNPAAPTKKATYATDKDPEGVGFLDGRWMVVANDLGDSLSLVDRTAGTVTHVALEGAGDAGPAQLPGLEPVGVAYDAANSLLYVPLAAANAVAAYTVDLTATPPTIVPAGKLPTSWWPSSLLTMPDGSVVVASMQGQGSGPDDKYFDIGNGDINLLMRGGIQHIPAPSMSDLTTGAANIAAWNNVAGKAGNPTVSCPAGASDFPVPATNTEGPSSEISHVFFIIRENKSFDGLFGDFPNVNGDPAYTMKTLSGEMDVIWANYRELGRTFAMSDNFYNDAVESIQGHTWTTYGRSNDFCERTWPVSGDGRNARPIPGSGVANAGKPVEGSLFDWLGNNGIDYDILGEEVGLPANQSASHPPIDTSYPGGPFITLGYSDDEKACHIAGRARVTCDFGSFVYATVPNDHTYGITATRPAPETYCAINDEATGMLVDAITHSPLWASSLIIITEDDPSQGGEHVDAHRSPIVLVSPWVKRAYMSKTHFDMSSLHKMFAHIFGKPYLNTMVADASLPFDIFSSTPDYTPYNYKPRTFPLYCGEATTQAEGRLTRSWDFSEPDEQPGLGSQVMRWMRGKQLDHLPPRLEREIEARWERRLRKPAAQATHAPAWPALDGDEDEAR